MDFISLLMAWRSFFFGIASVVARRCGFATVQILARGVETGAWGDATADVTLPARPTSSTDAYATCHHTDGAEASLPPAVKMTSVSVEG
jgi:hypothetical protein